MASETVPGSERGVGPSRPPAERRQQRWFEFTGLLRRRAVRRLALLAVLAMLGLTSWFDVVTGPGREPAALYDLPILLAAVAFGMGGACATAAVASAAFYLTLRHHGEALTLADGVQTALFFLLGVVVAQLVTEFRKARVLELELRRLNQELERRVAEAVGAERAAQERLRGSERLAALGEAAAHIVHEVKNPLVSIGGFARRVRRRITDEHPAAPELDIIVEESARLHALLGDLLEFARPPAGDRRPIAAGLLFEEVRMLAELPAQRQRVSLDFRCGAGAPAVVGDCDQIRRAVLNVVLNGIQAMSAGGRLTVTVEPAVVKGTSGLTILVQDNGVGIPPEQLGRIFDPFYTTKRGGTGLGLPLVKKTIEAHGGEVEVSSAPGSGTTVAIRLPTRADLP